MKKIRLLHVIGQLRRGGCELQLLGLCERLDKDRFDLSVCYYTKEGEELDQEFVRAGVRTVFFDKFAMPVWRFFLRLRRVMKETAPDIVHTWMYSANFWGRLAAVSCGVPHLIASERGEVRLSGPVDRAAERFFQRRTLRMANSRFLASSLEQHFGLPADQTRIVYNGVGFELPDRGVAGPRLRRELGLPRESLIVLTVGRIGFPKNYKMLVRVVERLHRSGSEAVFAIVGTGPEEAAIRQQVHDAGLDGKVRFLGFRGDVPSLLAAADLFCFTSDSEGFPNAVLEAMLAGLPVVCTDFPSAREMIFDPKAGILVPRDDDEGMAREIDALLKEPARREAVGLAARRHVQEHFSWERMTGRMTAIYEGLVAGSRNEAGG